MTIRTALRQAAHRYAGRPALWAGGQTLSYRQMSSAGAKFVEPAKSRISTPVVAIIAERKFPFYCAVFGAITNDMAYVPVNPKWPWTRVKSILELAAPDLILLDSATARADLGRGIASLDCARCMEMPAIDGDEMQMLSSGASRISRQYDANEFAYIMFTSGSTGAPKGVPITTSNVSHYVTAMARLIELGCEDRVLQTVEGTFDLSVHDMMLCWTAGALLAIVPEANAALGPRFVNQLGITSWLCVPSVAAQSKILGLLKPGAMPSLKTSLFCGEALPASLAATWKEAAPNTRLLNIYGPTEATIAFSAFEVFPDGESKHDIVPLGYPIGGQKMQVDETGELLLCGPQLSPGYLLDAAGTDRAFISRAGERWYRTGDRASYEQDVGFLYHGRMDSQIKLRGYRVEIGEVESALRKHAGTDLVAVIPIKETGPSAFESIVGVVCGRSGDLREIRSKLRESLPEYMVPERIVAVSHMPKNANDKVDYRALHEMIEARGLSDDD